MSNILLTTIRDHHPEIRGATRAVLIVMADRADHSGKCWPSLATIARDAGVCVSTVKNALRRLRKTGLVSWIHTRAPDGDLGSNVYHITLGGRTGDDQPGANPAPPGAAVAPRVGQQMAGGRAGGGYKASLKHQKEASTGPPSLDSPNNRKNPEHRKTPEHLPTYQETIPPSLDTRPFRECWQQWKTHRQENRKPVRPTQAQAQLEKLAAMGVERATAAIRFSIAQGYQGIFEDKEQRTRHGLDSPVSRELRADQVGI